MTQVLKQPVLPILTPDRFIIAMDGVVVNGQKFTGNSSLYVACIFILVPTVLILVHPNSSIKSQNSGQTLANLDTGTTLAQIPIDYARAIYGDLTFLKFNEKTGNIIVPCDTQLNVSFIFGYVPTSALF